MSAALTRFGRDRALEMFADWTDSDCRRRSAAGAARPQGVERNLVLSLWEWGDAHGLRARRSRHRQA